MPEKRLFGLALADQHPFCFRNWRRDRPSGNLADGTKARRTDFKAGSALDAHVLIDNMDLIFAAGNRLYRAAPAADHAKSIGERA